MITPSYTNDMLIYDDTFLPAVVTARHWTDGQFEIVIRPIGLPDLRIVLDQDDIAAVNQLLRAQRAINADPSIPPTDDAEPSIPSIPSTDCYDCRTLTERVANLEISLQEDAATFGQHARRITDLETYFRVDHRTMHAALNLQEARMTDLVERLATLETVVANAAIHGLRTQVNWIQDRLEVTRDELHAAGVIGPDS